jgi:2-methylisocitrate lyase-like PEP mutase family enzyme
MHGMRSVGDKRRDFRRLHQSGCFILPNPWDAGGARYLAGLGFKALATTSSGLAWSRGRPDNGLGREQVLAHLGAMVEAADLPLNADFENGFGATARAVEESVGLAVSCGVAGLSIEDYTGRAEAPLFGIEEAVDRIRAARKAIDRAGGDVILVARAECFVAGRPDMAETLARLEAYANAGADCVYAPGLRTIDQVRAVVAAVGPTPVNVLKSSPDGASLQDLADAGVRRVSVGGALARASWGAFMRAAEGLAHGSFEGLAGAPSHDDLDALMRL